MPKKMVGKNSDAPSGVDVKNTSQLEPGAVEGKDWNSKNSQREHVSNPPAHGPLGGMNTGS